MVAAPEGGHGERGNDNACPTLRKMVESEVKKGSAARTPHVVVVMVREALGGTSGTLTRNVIAFGEGPVETVRDGGHPAGAIVKDGVDPHGSNEIIGSPTKLVTMSGAETWHVVMGDIVTRPGATETEERNTEETVGVVGRSSDVHLTTQVKMNQLALI